MIQTRPHGPTQTCSVTTHFENKALKVTQTTDFYLCKFIILDHNLFKNSAKHRFASECMNRDEIIECYQPFD